MDFGKVLTGAWQTIWKHKILWLFGILAGCGGQTGNFGGNFNFRTGQNEMPNLPPQMQRFFTQWNRGFEQFFSDRDALFFIGLICIGLLLFVLFWAIGVYGKVGLIRGALRSETGKPVSFGSVHADVWPLYGSALGLNFLLVIIPIVVVIAVGLLAAVFVVGTLGFGLLCLIPLICVVIPLAIGYNVFTEMANIALIREGAGIGSAISKGWQVLRDHLGPLAGMALILILGGLLVGAILTAPMLAIFAPAFFALIGDQPQAVEPALWTTGILLLIAIPIYIVLGGIISSYVQSAWTLTYQQLNPAAAVRKARAKA